MELSTESTFGLLLLSRYQLASYLISKGHFEYPNTYCLQFISLRTISFHPDDVLK